MEGRMQWIDLVRLVVLSGIWGSSFIFMKILAPILGPVGTACLRLTIAGVALVLFMVLTQRPLAWRLHVRQYLIIGIVNSALPFFLYAYAALHIPAGYSVIFNASSPLWGAIFSAIWLGEALSGRKVVGIILGALGVSLVSQADHSQLGEAATLAILACLVAALCYGLAGVYTKKQGTQLQPMAVAAGSQMLAGFALMPGLAYQGIPWPLAPSIILAILALALVCSALAYLLYFRLIADVGPTQALTVTFLMPAFGMLWGHLFLGEDVTMGMLLGCALIVGGTILVLNPRFLGGRSLSPKSE